MSRSLRGQSTVVRWRDGAGQQRAVTLDRAEEAETFDESVKRVSAVLGRDSLPSRESAARDAVYPYRLNDGTTRYYVKYRTSDGRSATKRGFASRRAARAWKHDISVKARRGQVRQSQRPVAEDFDAWLTARKPYLTAGTWRDYEIHGRVRIKPFMAELGVRRLRQLDGALVSDWLCVLLESERWGAKTLNNALAVLTSFLNDAVRRGLMPRNPALEVSPLPAEHREMDYLRLPEIPRYLDACDETYRPIAEILIATGMRISEALALVFRDIVYARRVILVHRSAKRGEMGATKGKRFRQVNIALRHVEILQGLQTRRAQVLGRDVAGERIFLGPRGGRLTRSDVSRDMHKEALRQAGLRESLRLHDLRHTAAATWLALGKPLIYAQRQLGHASITTTEHHYGHLEHDYLANAATEIDAQIWRRPPAAIS